MRSIGIGEIHAVQADVAEADAIVRHLLHKHLSRHGCRTVGLHIVDITMQQSADVGHEGNDLRQFAHIEMVDAKGYVLFRLIVWCCIDFSFY